MDAVAGSAGQWAEVRLVLLPPGERAPSLPEDTAALPLEARVRGFLAAEARIGERAAVRTAAGRLVEGTLAAIEPAPGHSFGRPVPELLRAGAELRASRSGGEAADG
jgi:hypothetical protein